MKRQQGGRLVTLRGLKAQGYGIPGGKMQSLPLEFDALVRKPVGLPVGAWLRGHSTPTRTHAGTGNNR